MTTTSKPVWVWLPAQDQPRQCATFSLTNGIGSFSYLPAYRELPEAIALDPVHLPLTRSTRIYKETLQEGLFGVIRDASPEGFGLALLESMKGITLSDPLLRLELSEGDAVGAIEICDDITAKQCYAPPSLDDLLQILASLPTERPSSQAARELKGIHGTSLGGERPKLTVLHKGQYWIAKLQDRGDPPHAPLREYVAMRIAKKIGLQVADVEFYTTAKREVILVKRFDRSINTVGLTNRNLYASAHTVLRLDHGAQNDRLRSYVAFAHELQRFCADRIVVARPLQRELWKRMVYNVICGNGDDHPRNHGVLHHDGHWGLAPAFDIAPYTTYSGVQSMALTRDGKRMATRTHLLQDCKSFGWQPTCRGE